MRPALLALPLFALSAFTACGPVSDADFREILPDDRVLVDLPEPDASSARVGEWSEFYVLTKQVTDDVNGLAGYVLVLVDTITGYPPTWSDASHTVATWGPFADALDPVETQLWVAHDVETDGWTWGFDQRPKNLPDAGWTTVVAGEVDAGATHEASRGRFVVDWTKISEFDPTVHAVGTFAVDYDIAPTGVVAQAAFDEAVYSYQQVAGGDGAMDLALQADLAGSATPAEEALIVRSRWQATGAGRSDATITGGDLGAIVATASECWDAHFKSAYYVDNFTPLEEGDPGSCLFAEPEYNQTND